ncbi:MAG: YitT family protein [Clostridiales bacterium]|nr:YitT family protein [Clostridiales bacterium]
MNQKKIKGVLVDCIFDIVGSILYSIGVYTFAKMANFAPGGISGLALIMNHLWNTPIGLMTLILNIPLVLISYKVVGRKFLFQTARTVIICTIFLDFVFPHTPAYTGSPFLAALYYGIFLGTSLTIFYMRGSSSGGTDLIIMTIKKLYPHLSIGAVTMIIDFFIILLGWLVFGNIDAVLYGLVGTGVTSIVINKIMYGADIGKMAIIITQQGQAVADEISNQIRRGSTIISARGSYTKSERDVLLCACSKSQAYMIKKTVFNIDPRAFVVFSETSEVFGEGFISK